MGASIQSKADYSFLFSGLGSSSKVAGSNFFTEHASIKNGSYYKLMKAYYGKDASDAVKSIGNKSGSKDNSATISKVQDTTDALKDSADKLLANGSKSVFNKVDVTKKDENGVESTSKGYDVDAIYKGVEKFVKDYNSVVNATKDSKSTSIQGYAQNMVGYTAVNKKSLNDIGITVNSDNTLSIDEKTFRNANMEKVKSLFNQTGSYGYRTSTQASMINMAADREASKAPTYNAAGTYTNNFNTGNIFNGFY